MSNKRLFKQLHNSCARVNRQMKLLSTNFFSFARLAWALGNNWLVSIAAQVEYNHNKSGIVYDAPVTASCRAHQVDRLVQVPNSLTHVGANTICPSWSVKYNACALIFQIRNQAGHQDASCEEVNVCLTSTNVLRTMSTSCWGENTSRKPSLQTTRNSSDSSMRTVFTSGVLRTAES